jgi:hypothetical protein
MAVELIQKGNKTMSENAEKARLAQAQQLVKERKFDEARAILEQMPNNRTAQAWLQKLNEVSPPTGQPAPPPGGQAPPPQDRRQSASLQDRIPSSINRDELMQQADAYLDRAGIDRAVALKVLIIAAVSAVLASLLDTVIGLPTGALGFTFSWIVAVLNGMTYAYLLERFDLGGVIMAAVTGFVAYELWYILTVLLIGGAD